LEFSKDLLAVFYLHERWRQRLNHHQNLFSQRFVADHNEGLLKYVISKLVVDQALHDEMNSGFQILRFLGVKPKLLYDLLVILRESAFEYLIDVLLFLRPSVDF
jgi:hypothetical protein